MILSMTATSGNFPVPASLPPGRRPGGESGLQHSNQTQSASAQPEINFVVSGSAAMNQITLPLNAANSNVFFRLVLSVASIKTVAAEKIENGSRSRALKELLVSALIRNTIRFPSPAPTAAAISLMSIRAAGAGISQILAV